MRYDDVETGMLECDEIGIWITNSNFVNFIKFSIYEF